VTPAFLVGLVLAFFSRHRHEIRRLMAATEPQLRLPCLLLAGAMLDWPKTSREWLIVAIALGARWGGKMLLGLVIAKIRGLPPGSGIWLGRQLLRASGFSIALGLVIFLRQSDVVGRAALTAAVLGTVLGELFAPRSRVTGPSPESMGAPQRAEGPA
jgi:Kef-type K+ transport system membrane component KefB